MANFINNKWCRNAQYSINNWCRLAFFSAIALTSLASCVKEDLDDCPVPATSKVALQFDYTYNIKEADAFSTEVKNINVYVFDKDGKFINSYTESSDQFETGHTMEIRDLKDGKYTIVCLARDCQSIPRTSEDEREFSFASLIPDVSTIDDLTAKMGKENFENNKDFAALYTAQTQIDFKRLDDNGKEGNIVVGNLSLMKCTKSYRIVLLPYDNNQTDFKPENFDIRIEGSAAWLDHQGRKYKNQSKAITYLPYNQEHRKNYNGENTLVEDEPIDQALVYDLTSSRMFERKSDDIRTQEQSAYDDKRIIITDLRDKGKPKVVFNHSLPWLLALCGERKGKDWKDQEYLDRQDQYVLTFYVPDNRDYNLDARVKVNGWVLNLQDASLGGSEKQSQDNSISSFNQ